jgi:hypothetical protein
MNNVRHVCADSGYAHARGRGESSKPRDTDTPLPHPHISHNASVPLDEGPLQLMLGGEESRGAPHPLHRPPGRRPRPRTLTLEVITINDERSTTTLFPCDTIRHEGTCMHAASDEAQRPEPNADRSHGSPSLLSLPIQEGACVRGCTGVQKIGVRGPPRVPGSSGHGI